MRLFNFISDIIVGPCIRNIASNGKVIYLTFDDGPNNYCTPKILDLLKKHNAKASFFIIGNNIKNNTNILDRIISEGHSVGNHSIDHSTSIFVKGKKALQNWIDRGEAIIVKHTGKATVGFRPPVGIRTPELRLIMRQNNEKPIMWQHRFFDTQFKFTEKTWNKKIKKIKSGDILLLHDTHIDHHEFLTSLESFIKYMIKEGFQLNAIKSSNLIQAN